jgi:hypothetical protein
MGLGFQLRRLRLRLQRLGFRVLVGFGLGVRLGFGRLGKRLGMGFWV